MVDVLDQVRINFKAKSILLETTNDSA